MSTQRDEGTIGPGVILGGVSVAALWSVCYPLVTVAVEHAAPLRIAALRAGLAGLTLLLFSIATRRPMPHGREWVAVLVIGLTATSLGFGGMFMAGGRISPGIAEVVANAQPFLAALMGYVALREPLRGRQIAGMALAFAGIAMVAIPAMGAAAGSTVTGPGLAFVVAAAFGVASGNVLMKHFSARLDPVVTTAWQLLAGGTVLFVVVVFVDDPGGTVQWSPALIWALVGLAIPGTAIAYVLWFGLLARAPLNSLNVFSFLTPVFGLALGWWFFDERLSVLQFGGAGLVVSGAVVASLSRPRRTEE